jgi:esterase/lipase superfamily enzyme
MPTVTVYFATNRQPHNDANDTRIVGFGPELGPTGGLDVRYGSAQVEVDLKKQTHTFIPDSLVVADQTLIFPAGSSPTLGSTTIFEVIRNDMATAKRPTIAFIHGFSNSFVEAIERAGWILAFYGIDANIFVFTWPSSSSAIGAPLPYADHVHDRGTAAASGPAVAHTIRRLYDFVEGLQRDQHCMESIHLLCHSMGNYVLRNAVQALMRLPDATAATAGDVRSMSALSSATPDPSLLRRTFDKIVLAAADEDADAFDDPAKLKYLPRLGQSVTVYHSPKDWVLNTLSAVTKFNGPRLGNDGPDNMGTISDKVSAIDVSEVLSLTQDPENHQYYRVYPAVRDDIVDVLEGVAQNQIANREPISDGRWRIKSKTRPKAAKSKRG